MSELSLRVLRDRAAADAGVLRLHLCRVDGVVAGFLLEIAGPTRSLMLKSEFDQAYRNLSVG